MSQRILVMHPARLKFHQVFADEHLAGTCFTTDHKERVVIGGRER